MPVDLKEYDFIMMVVALASLVLFILYTLVKVVHKGYYYRLFYILLRQDYSTSSFAQSNNSFNNAGYYILIASVLSYTTAVFSVLAYSGKFPELFTDSNVVISFLVILVSVVAFVFLKWLIYSVWGWLFEFSEYSKEYLKLFFNNIRATALIIFPFFLFIPFVGFDIRNVLIVSVLGVICIAGLYSFYTFWRYSFKIKFFNHYAILYFCTFEILPILVLWKFFGEF